MQLLFSNEATTTIAGSISSTSTTINLATGSGALFPNPTSGSQYFIATLNSVTVSGLQEIVWVTARSSDSVTVVRAQEGTTASGFNAGDTFSLLLTAGGLGSFLQLGQLAAAGWQVYQTPGTYSFVPSTTSALALAWGPGGGGGGCSGNNYGTGGGGGSFAAKFFTGLSSSSPVTVLVGQGGSGGSSGGGTGSTGTESAFGTMTAFGGEGGVGNGDGGGIGGDAHNGDITFSGVGGSFGQFAGSNIFLGGIGGASWFGANTTVGVNANAGSGTFPGVGGNGAGSNTGTGYAGGNGANGMVIVLWFH